MSISEIVFENSHRIFYGLALVMALIKYPKYFDTPLKYFPILLMYTFLNELLGTLVRENEAYAFVWSEFYSHYNAVIYNIYNIVFFSYFIYVFWSYTEGKRSKKIIAGTAWFFLITSAINPFIESFMYEPQTFTYIVGATILIGCIYIYFRELHLKLDIWFLKKDLLSWIGIGMLIFYLGYLPIKISRYYNAVNGLTEGPHIRNIQLILVMAMYGSFIVGFFLMRRRRTTLET